MAATRPGRLSWQGRRAAPEPEDFQQPLTPKNPVARRTTSGLDPPHIGDPPPPLRLKDIRSPRRPAWAARSDAAGGTRDGGWGEGGCAGGGRRGGRRKVRAALRRARGGVPLAFPSRPSLPALPAREGQGARGGGSEFATTNAQDSRREVRDLLRRSAGPAAPAVAARSPTSAGQTTEMGTPSEDLAEDRTGGRSEDRSEGERRRGVIAAPPDRPKGGRGVADEKRRDPGGGGATFPPTPYPTLPSPWGGRGGGGARA